MLSPKNQPTRESKPKSKIDINESCDLFRAGNKSKKQKQEATSDVPSKPLSLETPQELLELIEVLGTKMANLIFYLKKLWINTADARVIIFSQFDSVLLEVDHLLEAHGIQTVTVKGYNWTTDTNLTASEALIKKRLL